MIAVAWLALLLGFAIVLLGASPAVPTKSMLLHYVAGAVGLVVIVLAVVRLAD